MSNLSVMYVGVREISEDGLTELIEFTENPCEGNYLSYREASIQEMNDSGLNGYLGEMLKVKEGVVKYVKKLLWYDEDDEAEDGFDLEDYTYNEWILV